MSLSPHPPTHSELPCWGLNPGPWLDTLGTVCLATSSSILFLLRTPQIAFLANGSPWPGSEVPCELCHSPGMTPHSCPRMLFCRLAPNNLYGNHIDHLSFKSVRGRVDHFPWNSASWPCPLTPDLPRLVSHTLSSAIRVSLASGSSCCPFLRTGALFL